MSESVSSDGVLSAAKRELLMLMLEKQKRIRAVFDPLAPMTVEAMTREAALDDSIDPGRAAQPFTRETRSVLLTGATGFIGAFLLDELARQTSAEIHCLVRAANREEAFDRLRRNLHSYRISMDEYEHRVIPVPADLLKPLAGLSPYEFDRLAESIDLIVHCAAQVKWTQPFRTLRGPNVDGTAEMVRLACQRRLKHFHFISTVGVFSSPAYNHDTVLETEELQASGPLYTGYAQTKWVAEQMVRKAAERGLPISIYRPNTAPDSRTGAFNPNDHITLMIKGSVQLLCGPRWDMQVAGAPIDYAAKAIVSIALQSESTGKTFHIVNPRNTPWNDLLAWTRAYGYQLRHVPFDEWRRELIRDTRRSGDNALRGLTPFFSDTVLENVRLPLFDSRQTLSSLAGRGVHCPPLDSAFWDICLRRFIESGYMEGPAA
jgi:thioester reductase-like protein